MSDTTVSIQGDQILINGRPTYEGRRWKDQKIQGLLFNSRMANAIADDENPSTRGVWAYRDGPWDADRNTREFCEALPEYRAHGLLGVCLNLQGGSPHGYSQIQPWTISAFEADGTLKAAWAERLRRVLEATDRLGMVVVLGLFYGPATRHLADEQAVRRAVDQSVDWLATQGARNVLLEIGNEIDHTVYHHRIIEAPRCHELIEQAQRRSEGRLDTPAGRLLVGASLLKPRTDAHNIIGASDFAAARQPRQRPRGTRAVEPRRHPAAAAAPAQLARLPRPADLLQRGRPLRFRARGQPPARGRRGLCGLGLLRLPALAREARGRLPVAAGGLAHRLGAQEGLLRQAQGNHRGAA